MHAGRRWDQDQKTQSHKQKANGKLRRTRRLTAAQPDPQPGIKRGKENHKDGLNVLKPARRELITQYHAVRVTLRKKAKRRSCLFIHSPEDGGGDEQHQDRSRALALLGGPTLA